MPTEESLIESLSEIRLTENKNPEPSNTPLITIDDIETLSKPSSRYEQTSRSSTRAFSDYSGNAK